MEDYLIHYGVLGMKWGIHKAKKYERKAKRSTGEKKLKYKNKAKKLVLK